MSQPRTMLRVSVHTDVTTTSVDVRLVKAS